MKRRLNGDTYLPEDHFDPSSDADATHRILVHEADAMRHQHHGFRC